MYIYICTYYIIISWDGISWDTMGYHGIQQESNGMSWHVMGCSDTVRYTSIYISIYECIYICAIYRINNTIIQYGSGHKNEDLRPIYDYLIMENDGFGHAILELVHVLFIYI